MVPSLCLARFTCAFMKRKDNNCRTASLLENRPMNIEKREIVMRRETFRFFVCLKFTHILKRRNEMLSSIIFLFILNALYGRKKNRRPVIRIVPMIVIIRKKDWRR